MIATQTTTSKMEIRLEQFTSEDSGKKYYLVIRKSDGIAIDCQCGDRQHRGRKHGKACKHMRKFNTRLVLTALAEWMNGFNAVLQSPDVQAACAEAANERKMQEFRNAYEALASTKNVTVVEGHICQGCCTSYRPEYEEQVFCRRCS